MNEIGLDSEELIDLTAARDGETPALPVLRAACCPGLNLKYLHNSSENEQQLVDANFLRRGWPPGGTF